MNYKNKQFLELIAEVLEVKKNSINDKSSIDNVEKWDSHAHLNLILALERKFKISFDDEEVVTLLTIKLIKLALEKHNIHLI